MECSRTKALHLYQYIEVIKTALSAGKTCRLDIIGESMSPTLDEGDSVILGAPVDISKRDIILYRVSDTEFVLHRVVSTRGGITARGDNNIANESVDRDSIIAKVQTISHGKRTISRHSVRYYNAYVYSVVRRFMRRVRNRLLR